jgi:hypothetical protein
MAQAGYTPIQLYFSTTAAAVPLAANLAQGELAINIADGKLYYENSSGVVTLLASSTTVTNSFSAGTTGFTPSTATTGAVTLAGTLITSNGGTGLASYTAGDLSYYASGTALTKLAIGTAGQFLTSTGTAPQWSTLSGVAVTTFSAGTTGFTPSSATSGAVTLAGTLATTNGGTGLTSFTSGGVVYASSSSALATGSGLTYDGSNLSVGRKINLNVDGVATSGFYNGVAISGYDALGWSGSSTLALGGYRASQWTQLDFYTGGSTGLTLTNSSLYTASGINVGIGTSSPAATLTVSHASGVDGRGIRLVNSSNAQTWENRIGVQSLENTAYAIKDITAGTVPLLIQASTGNVGINNTSPSVLASTTQVAIKANSSADAMFVAQNSNGLTTAKFGFQFTGGVDNPVIGSYTDNPFIFQTNNTERARFTGSAGGSLLVGTSTLRVTGYTTGYSQYAMENIGYGGAQWFTNRADDIGSFIVVGKSRGTVVNSNTVVANGDELGALVFMGATGSGVASAAFIYAKVDGATISSSSMPGRLSFHTTASGSTAPTERMRITSAGDVGIGISSPSSYANYTTVSIGNTSGGEIDFYASGTNVSQIYGNAAGTTFATLGGRNTIFMTNGVERVRIDSSGNMIVGSTGTVDSSKFQIFGAKTISSGIPQQQLNVADTTAIAAGVGGAISFSALYSGAFFTTMGSVEGVRENGTEGNYAGALVFKTRANGGDNNERARITSAGDFLAGCTAVPTFGDSTGSGFAFSKTYKTTFFVQDAPNSYACTYFNATSYTSGTAYFAQFRVNGATVGNITTNGTSTSYDTSSDYRLKNTIAPMTGALAKVAQLKPVTYKWNVNGSDGEGFIAHELAEVCPNAVTGAKDAVDADGKPNYQGIDVSFLVATLTAAIQEQQAIIDSLKARLDAANL